MSDSHSDALVFFGAVRTWDEDFRVVAQAG
jgi:hypothetical protein